MHKKLISSVCDIKTLIIAAYMQFCKNDGVRLTSHNLF